MSKKSKYKKLAKRFYDYIGGEDNLRYMSKNEIENNIKGFVKEYVKKGFIPEKSEQKTIDKLKEFLKGMIP